MLFAGKRQQHVSFPLHIDLATFAGYDGTAPGQEPHRGGELQLVAVVVHHGASALNGHYTVYRRAGGEEGEGLDHGWVHISDAEVRPCGLEAVLQAQAYLLFYVLEGGHAGGEEEG